MTNAAPAGIDDIVLSERDFLRIAAIIKADAGIALTREKKALVFSRLAKRVRILRLPSFSAYCDLLEASADQDERRTLLSALTTNVTYFFREPHHFEDLREKVLPELARKAAAGGRVRIWSAGCSTGQEPYCLALTALSAAPELARADFKILATDIDPEVLAIAERGVYEKTLLSKVSEHDQSAYFHEIDDLHAEIKPDVRKLISFRRLNLISHWPVKGPFDVIMCRNVVIYFDQDTQEMIWRRFAQVMDADSRLYVGHSERISGPARAAFKPAGITIYTKASGLTFN